MKADRDVEGAGSGRAISEKKAARQRRARGAGYDSNNLRLRGICSLLSADVDRNFFEFPEADLQSFIRLKPAGPDAPGASIVSWLALPAET